MTRVRLVLGCCALTLVAGAAAASAAPPPQPIGPDVAGWWSTANRSSSVPAVAPPDVGAKDLYVAGSNALPSPLPDLTGAGPAAIAALHFRLPDGVSAKQLRLRLAGTHPPAVTVTACRATETFTAAYDGAWADAPAYDCTDSGTARLDPDGSVVLDDVDGLREGRDLSVALVPGPLDRVVVAAPDSRTLTMTAAAGPVSGAPGAGSPLPPAGPAGGTGQTFQPGGPASVPGSEPARVPAAPTAGTAPAIAAPAAPLRPQAAASQPGAPARPWPALLATALVALAAFVPIVGPLGRPAVAGSARGVGRFRAERSGPVPDLA